MKIDFQRLFFKANDAPIWDTWVYFHDETFYLYYLWGPFAKWSGIGLAISSDGVEWRDQGKIINAAADVLWLGSGAVWRSGDKFVMNFSEWRGPSTWEGRQTIFFAVSADLVCWERMDASHEFRPDERWYDPAGRWDNIWPVRRLDGGYDG